MAGWRKKLKEFSGLFNAYPKIYESSINLSAEATNKYLVNSEGTSIQHAATHWRLGIVASTKAEDGMDLYRYESFDAHTLDGLPEDQIIRQTIEVVAKDVLALCEAPVIEPYTGPAILTGRAASVFFHEIFWHRIEGHRQKDEEEGQTFTKKVNQQVLPDFISVYDDPTLERSGEKDLSGHLANPVNGETDDDSETESKDGEKEVSEKLSETDYQLFEALNLLKGLTIANRIHQGNGW